MSDQEIERLLRSLPRVKAAPHLESRISALIARRGKHMPIMLGSLPMVSAHEDFDERLRDAIHDRRRPVAPPPIDSRTASRPHFGRWVSGVVVVGGLLFGFRTVYEGDPYPGARHAPVSSSVQTIASPATGGISLTTRNHGPLPPSPTSLAMAFSDGALTMRFPSLEARGEEIVTDPRSGKGGAHHATPSNRLPEIPLAVATSAAPLPSVPRTLPASQSRRVIEIVHPQLEPPATGSEVREDDDNEAPHELLK